MYQQLMNMSLTKADWIKRLLAWSMSIAIIASFYVVDYPKIIQFVLFIVILTLYRYGTDVGSPYPKHLLQKDLLIFGTFMGALVGGALIYGLNLFLLGGVAVFIFVYFPYITKQYKKVLPNLLDQALETESKEDVDAVLKILAFNEKNRRFIRLDQDDQQKLERFNELLSKHYQITREEE